MATRLSAAHGAYAVAAGLLALLGWLLDVRRLAAWDNSITQMPNSAVAGIAAGTALICCWRGRHRAATALGLVAALIATATLFEHITGIDLGIDRLLLVRDWGRQGTVAPGRMGIPGSICLAAIGFSIAARRSRRYERWAVACGLLTMAITMLSLIGYLFSADPLYAIPKLTTIALQTATMLFALGAGLVLSLPDRAPMSVLLGDSAASVLLRRTLPGIVLLVLILGWLSLRAQQANLFDAPFAIAVLVFVLMALQVAVLWHSAGAVAVHEAELQESEKKFALLFQKAPFGAALATLPEGRFVDVNEAFERMFGVAREQAIGRTSLDLGINPDAMGRRRVIDQVQEEGLALDREVTLVTGPGGKRTFINNVTVVELRGEKYLLTTLQDITERKTAEETLRAADRMKDEFLATLSHEMRTPLTAIIGWSQLLLNANLEAKEQRVAIEAIRSSARAQAQLTDDILDVSRITTGKMRLQQRWVALAEVVEAAAATTRPAAEGKRVPLQLTLDRSLPPHFVDPERIQQVVWNLLSNSIKFSPPGAPVEVALRGDRGGTTIEVIDHGRGIAPEFLPHVFERFRQADSSSSRTHAGLGLGLALSRDLVELHGGRIEAASEEGRGSCFTVWLPPPQIQSAADAPAPAPEASLDGVRVMYVDDHADARLLVATMLREHGADVVDAASADEALSMLPHARPDVVVTDLAMPFRDGYSLLASIRADSRWGQLPILALTAQGLVEDESNAQRAGFQAFLRKPIESQDLAAAVARAAADRR